MVLSVEHVLSVGCFFATTGRQFQTHSYRASRALLSILERYQFDRASCENLVRFYDVIKTQQQNSIIVQHRTTTVLYCCP